MIPSSELPWLWSLGADFLDEVQRVLREITANPGRYGFAEDDIREGLLNRFPYAIYYRALADRIPVPAVFHSAAIPRAGNLVSSTKTPNAGGSGCPNRSCTAIAPSDYSMRHPRSRAGQRRGTQRLITYGRTNGAIVYHR